MLPEQHFQVVSWMTSPTEQLLNQRKIQKISKSIWNGETIAFCDSAKIFLRRRNIFCQGNGLFQGVVLFSQHLLLCQWKPRREMLEMGRENIINPVFFTQLPFMLFYFYFFPCFYEAIINLVSQGQARFFSSLQTLKLIKLQSPLT